MAICTDYSRSALVKLLILSDLHLEFAGFSPPPGVVDDVDAVILAGDTLPNTRKLAVWASRPTVFGEHLPIVALVGNHELYGGQLEARRRELQEAAAKISNFHALDPGELLLDEGSIRILGCTLWTSFDLAVTTATGKVSDRARAIREAGKRMNDYVRITVADDTNRGEWSRPRRLTPEDVLRLHFEDRNWLLAKLDEPFEGATVVVTHHGLSSGSVAERWERDWLTPSFSNELPDQFFAVPTLWVHGHTHDSFDYRRGSARMVANPRGYQLRSGGFENAAFDPAMVVEV